MKDKKQEFRMSAAAFDEAMRRTFQTALQKKSKGARRRKTAKKA
jgi:hypothetical protein